MPPKAQKKEGSTDTPTTNTSGPKDQDVVSIDDILFPKVTVGRIAKSTLTDGEGEDSDKSQFLLSKDSVTVIQRSSVVFISHLFHHALQASKADARRTANAQDVLNALKSTGFGAYVPILEEELEKFNEKANLKRQLKQSSAKTDSAAPGEEGEEEDEEEEEEDTTEDSNKKLKTNEGAIAESPAKKVTVNANTDEEDATPAAEVDVVEIEDEEEVEELEEDGDTKLKPSQIVAKDHKELEGDSPESVYEDAEEDDQE